MTLQKRANKLLSNILESSATIYNPRTGTERVEIYLREPIAYPLPVPADCIVTQTGALTYELRHDGTPPAYTLNTFEDLNRARNTDSELCEAADAYHEALERYRTARAGHNAALASITIPEDSSLDEEYDLAFEAHCYKLNRKKR